MVSALTVDSVMLTDWAIPLQRSITEIYVEKIKKEVMPIKELGPVDNEEKQTLATGSYLPIPHGMK